MQNSIKVGDKLGYLNLKTGNRKWVEIVSINLETNSLVMCELIKVGRTKVPNIYSEGISQILEFTCKNSVDFKDNRKLIKHKSVKSNYMTEPQRFYFDSLNQ